MIDISDEMAAQEALRANEQLLRRLTEALPLGVLQIDIERTIVYSNDRLDDIVGVSDARTVDELFSNIAVTDRPALNKAVIAALAEGRDADLQFALTHRYLGSRRCAVSVRALTSDSGSSPVRSCASPTSPTTRACARSWSGGPPTTR